MQFFPNLSSIKDVKSVIAGISIVFTMMSAIIIVLILKKDAFGDILFTTVLALLVVAGIHYSILLCYVGILRQRTDMQKDFEKNILQLMQENTKLATEIQRTQTVRLEVKSRESDDKKTAQPLL